MFAKTSIVHVRQGFEYVSAFSGSTLTILTIFRSVLSFGLRLIWLANVFLVFLSSLDSLPKLQSIRLASDEINSKLISKNDLESLIVR